MQREPEVAAQHERPERPRHDVELVEREQAADEREREEPPAAEVHEADHEREQDRDDEDAGEQRTHRAPNRRARLAYSSTRDAEALLAEVGPQRVVEDELGVRRLPEQEVRDPLLAGGADDEIRIGELGRVEVGRDVRFGQVLVSDTVSTPSSRILRIASTSSARPP